MSLNTILATTPLTSTGYHLKATGTTIGNSLIWDNGTNVGIGNTNTSYTLDVSGTGRFTSTLLVSGAATFGSTITASGNLNLQAGAVRNINFYDSSNTNINAQIQYDQISATSGQLFFGTNNAGTFATRLTITNAGNVGIGTTSPTAIMQIQGAQAGVSGKNLTISYNGTYYAEYTEKSITAFNNELIIGTGTGGTEKMRITGGGYTKISNTGTYEYVSAAVHEIRNSAADYILYATNPNANPSGYYISYPSASPNGLANYFIACADSTAARFRVASNGNCYNVTGTYTSGVSDIRYKEQIVDANSQWNDIKNLRVVNFKFIKDVEENGDNALRHIGFIAQEVEKTSPHLIDEMSDEKTGETWKTIKTSIIHTKSIKALQEAMARIETLESTIQNLQEQINILAK